MKRRLSSLAGNWRWKVKLTMKSTVTKAGRDCWVEACRSPGWVFAIVGRGIIARRELELDDISCQCNVIFSFLFGKGTCALHRPAAAFSRSEFGWLQITSLLIYHELWKHNKCQYVLFLQCDLCQWAWSLRRLVLASVRILGLCGAVPSLHEWRDSAWFPFLTASQAWTFVTQFQISRVLSGNFCFCSLSNRRPILVLVGVLTIIKWKASRHNADMSQGLKKHHLGHSFWIQKTKSHHPCLLLTPA